MTRLPRAIVIAGCVLGSMSCGGESAGGPELAELSTEVEDLANHTTDPRCTTLPVLLGGRVRDEIDVAGEFSIVIDATPDVVWVSFDGVEQASELTLKIPALELAANFRERIELSTLAGRHFTVNLESECSP